jgi:DNA-binding Lrp family transcriptional regulator
MINAYLLGQLNPETEQNTIDKLRAINGVQEAHIVFGKFDLVVKLNAETQESLNNTILEEVRKITDITKTQTLLVAKLP